MCLLPGYGTTSSRGRETLSHLDASYCDFVAHQDNKVETQVWAVIDVDAPSRTSTILMLVTGRNWLSLVDISDRASTVTEFIILNDLCWKMVKHCTSGCILKTGTQSRETPSRATDGTPWELELQDYLKEIWMRALTSTGWECVMCFLGGSHLIWLPFLAFGFDALGDKSYWWKARCCAISPASAPWSLDW